MTIYKIDENGYLQYGCEIQIEDTEIIPVGYTSIPLPKNKDGQFPFYKPQLVNGAWIETLTQAEIDALNNVPIEPSEVEKLRIEQAQSNAEMIALMINMIGGVV